jgi:hypothetical protein
MAEMAEQQTPVEAVEPEEESGQEANLALVVAALGGGPGERRESGVRPGTTGRPPKGTG